MNSCGSLGQRFRIFGYPTYFSTISLMTSRVSRMRRSTVSERECLWQVLPSVATSLVSTDSSCASLFLSLHRHTPISRGHRTRCFSWKMWGFHGTKTRENWEQLFHTFFDIKPPRHIFAQIGALLGHWQWVFWCVRTAGSLDDLSWVSGGNFLKVFRRNFHFFCWPLETFCDEIDSWNVTEFTIFPLREFHHSLLLIILQVEQCAHPHHSHLRKKRCGCEKFLLACFVVEKCMKMWWKLCKIGVKMWKSVPIVNSCWRISRKSAKSFQKIGLFLTLQLPKSKSRGSNDGEKCTKNSLNIHNFLQIFPALDNWGAFPGIWVEISTSSWYLGDEKSIGSAWEFSHEPPTNSGDIFLFQPWNIRLFLFFAKFFPLLFFWLFFRNFLSISSVNPIMRVSKMKTDSFWWGLSHSSWDIEWRKHALPIQRVKTNKAQLEKKLIYSAFLLVTPTEKSQEILHEVPKQQ